MNDLLSDAFLATLRHSESIIDAGSLEESASEAGRLPSGRLPSSRLPSKTGATPDSSSAHVWKQRWERERERAEQLRVAIGTLASAIQHSPYNDPFLNSQEWMHLTAAASGQRQLKLRKPPQSAAAPPRERHPEVRDSAPTNAADPGFDPPRPGLRGEDLGFRHAKTDILFRLATDLLQWVCDSPPEQDAERKWFALQAIQSLHTLDRSTTRHTQPLVSNRRDTHHQ